MSCLPGCISSSGRFPRHIHDKGHSAPACGAQMSRKNCDISGTCQPPSSCSRAYVTRLGANKSRSHVTRLLIGTLTIAFWSSSTQSTLVADTPMFYYRLHAIARANSQEEYEQEVNNLRKNSVYMSSSKFSTWIDNVWLSQHQVHNLCFLPFSVKIT